MRKLVPMVAGVSLAFMLAGCGNTSLLGDRKRPDEFAVARQAPLVIPPDYALVPPQPGAPRPQETGAAAQSLEAMFGGPPPRSATEQQAIDATGRPASPGIRSEVGSPDTNVVDKGTTTRDIVAAPEGNGQASSTTTP